MGRHGVGHDRVTAERSWLDGDVTDERSALDALLQARVLSKKAKLSPLTAARLLRYAGAALSSGVPASAAFALAASAHDEDLTSQVSDDVATRIARGSSVAEALATHPEAFGHTVVSLVAAGERSGSTAQALELAAASLEDDDRAQSATRSVVLRPLTTVAAAVIVLAVCAVATSAVLTADVVDQLPRISRLLLTLGMYLPVVAVPALVLSGVRRAAAGRGDSPAGTGRRARSGPRREVHLRAHADVSSVVSWLLAAGMTVAEALAVAAQSARTSPYREALERATEQARSGATLTEALSTEPLLAPLAPAARVGEATGSLPAVLAAHADDARVAAWEALASTAAWTKPAAGTLSALLLGSWFAAVVVPALHMAAAR